MSLLNNWKITLTASEKFNITLIFLFVVIVTFMSIFKLDVTIQSSGVVVPQGHSSTFDTMVTGKVTKVNFQEGDTVKAGDVIVELDPGVGYEKYQVITNVDGKIQNLYYKNPGGVIKQGQNVVTIIPTDGVCIVEAKLLLKDRGYVKIGQKVKIKLNNIDSMNYAPINGEIISISPDAVQSQQGNYYVIDVVLEKQQFVSGSNTYDLYPGIDVVAHILTGERSVLNYLASPILSDVGNALQEK